MTAWVDLSRLSSLLKQVLLLERANLMSGINRLSGPYFFWKIILKHFKFKNDTIYTFLYLKGA